MKKSKTNVSVVSNAGIRRNVNVHIGDNGSFPSGDILDANATKQLVDNVAVTGDYNDLDNKPTIPNVATVNLEMEDLDMSTTPYTITNQDKISQICDLMDAKTSVFGTIIFNRIPSLIIYTTTVVYNGADLTNVSIVAATVAFSGPAGQMMVGAVADVTSRYVTSNTEP